MFSRLLIIAGLLFQPLLVVPTCACIQKPTDSHGCTSSACCVSAHASTEIEVGSSCCSQSAKTCCKKEEASAESSCRKFSNPVSLIALLDGCSCTCCCCSRPLAPVAGETQPLVESTSVSHSYSPPPHAVMANLTALSANHDSGLALNSCGTTQSRLCVWLN